MTSNAAAKASSSASRTPLSASPGIQKSSKRPPRQKSCQEQSLECLKGILKAAEGVGQQMRTVTKVVVETVVPCMASMQQEICEMKAEASMRWEADKEKTEKNHGEVLDRHEAVMQKLSSGVELLKNAGGQGSFDSNKTTLQKQVEAATDWVKYHVVMELIDTRKGADLYETLLGTTLKPSKIILRAARWALGENASDTDARRVLRQRMPEDGSSKNPPKVYSVISTARNRVLKPIRETFVMSFLPCLPEENSLHRKNEIGKPRRRRNVSQKGMEHVTIHDDDGQQEAIALYHSGDFKTKNEYDKCWVEAWNAAQKEGMGTANILMTHLEAYRSEGLPAKFAEIPETEEDKRKTSVFSLAFLRLKVSKFIQNRAEGDSRGMRPCHAPLWVKEVIRIQKTLRRRLQHDSLSDGSQIDSFDEKLELKGLLIRKMLSKEERDLLEEA